MRQLQDCSGNKASFTDAGDLVSLTSNGVVWNFENVSPSWRIVLDSEGKKSEAFPEPGTGKVIECQQDFLRIRFSQVTTSGGNKLELNAEAFWFLSDGLLHADLSVKELTCNEVLHEVRIPDIVLAYSDGPTSLIVPKEIGWEIKDAANVLFENNQAPEEFSVHHQMQFYAWIDSGRGFYTDCRDKEGWLKRWHFSKEKAGRFRLSIGHNVPRQSCRPRDFVMPYRVTLGGFHGGWYEAAQIYRKWAINATWASRNADERRNNSLADIACWIWNRGSSEEVCPPAKELADRLGLPVYMSWYWWEKHPYDTGHPEYFPPREGESRLKNSIRDMRQHNVRVQLYTNGMVYDMESPTWSSEGRHCAKVDEDGVFINTIYNPLLKHRIASTCGASDRWHEIMLDIARKVRSMGANGLYLDMIAAAGGAFLCYNQEHDHVPGGGCYDVQGFRCLLYKIRQSCPELVLTSESTTEFFSDLLDGSLTCRVSIERFKGATSESYENNVYAIPLFNAVYHGRHICFGNYTVFDGNQPFDDLWPKEFKSQIKLNDDLGCPICPDQFALEFGRTIIFGCQPLVGNLKIQHFTGEKFRNDIDFLVSMSRFYHENREFLLWGRLLPSGKLECPDREVLFRQSTVFTKAGEETYMRRRLPSVLHSEWESPSGQVAAFMVNYSLEDINITYNPPVGYKLEKTSRRGREDVLEMDIPARTAHVILLCAH